MLQLVEMILAQWLALIWKSETCSNENVLITIDRSAGWMAHSEPPLLMQNIRYKLVLSEQRWAIEANSAHPAADIFFTLKLIRLPQNVGIFCVFN